MEKSQEKNFSIIEILKKSREATSTMLNTNLGGAKESVYKTEIFEGLNDKQKASYRGRIRKHIKSIFETALNLQAQKNENELEKLSVAFVDFYKSTYIVNDFTFASVASENRKDKDMIINGLNALKVAFEKSQKKATKENK